MKNVEDVYPLTPMQELMLLNLLNAQSSEMLVDQFVYALNDLNV